MSVSILTYETGEVAVVATDPLESAHFAHVTTTRAPTREDAETTERLAAKCREAARRRP